MAEFIEIIKKDPNIKNEISQTMDQYNRESISTRSQIGPKASIQSKVCKQARNIMGETLSDLDIELEQKDNKILFLEDEIGIPDSKIVEEMNRLDSNKPSSKDKCERSTNRLNKTLNNQKYIEN